MYFTNVTEVSYLCLFYKLLGQTHPTNGSRSECTDATLSTVRPSLRTWTWVSTVVPALPSLTVGRSSTVTIEGRRGQEKEGESWGGGERREGRGTKTEEGGEGEEGKKFFGCI